MSRGALRPHTVLRIDSTSRKSSRVKLLVIVAFVLHEFLACGDKFGLSLRKIFRLYRLICYHLFEFSAATSSSTRAPLFGVIATKVRRGVKLLKSVVVV